jgi:hypothetical protein
MSIHGANTYLHQPVGQPLFEDAGERTRMREPVTLELVVQVRMGIDVNYGELGIKSADRPQDWVGHGVVATQSKWTPATRQQFGKGALNFVTRVGSGRQRQIAGIAQSFGEIESELGPTIPVE